ncbi:MAG: 30S ribosomal protein S18 [Bdellovibrio sp.]|nr:30S ribosomal protein S18 [Bdellovibrio sp.]
MGKDGDDRASKKFGAAVYHRKKICKFCSDTEFHLDYKDARIMQSFLTEHGKIVPRRISGNCAKHQRKLTIAVKRARILALVGYTSVGN